MGACCIKAKKSDPDEYSGVLLNKTESSPTLPSPKIDSVSLPDLSKFIDYDQYITLKILETCFTITAADKNQLQILIHKAQNLSKLETEAKLIQYGNLRCEETDLQKKLFSSIHDNFKNFQEIVNKKNLDVENKIEIIEKNLKNSKWMKKERETAAEDFKQAQNCRKEDFNGLLEKYKKLEKICEDLEKVEKNLCQGKEILSGIKEVENKVEFLAKSSLAALHHFEVILGESVDVSNIDVIAMKAVELDYSNFLGFFNSLEKHLDNLQELENLKNKALENNSIKDKLKAIDKTLTKHFLNSEQSKEAVSTRLNRVSRSQSEFAKPAFLEYLHFDTSEQSIPATISILKEKAKKYLKSLENQDKVLLEMTEKFNAIDKIIDEVELKFQDYISFEVKELHKWINNAEDWVKSSLDSLSEKLIQYEEETQHDLMARLESFQVKFSLTDDLNKIKSALKELHLKELNKVKSDMHEKVNELSSQVDQITNEKNLLESNFVNVKQQLQKTSKVTEDLLKDNNEREILITTLRGNLCSAEETLDQVGQEKNQLQDEVDELRKELRECKKALRSKEHELSELKESISSS